MNTNPIDQAVAAALDRQLEAVEWVDSHDRLAELCTRWRQLPSIGVDTEFIRTDTFWPRPGLIQIASEEGVWMIDPLAIADLGPLAELLADSSVLKILHACSEDIELFHHSLGVVPAPLFDTQVACAFLGQGLSVGYQRLLETLLDVSVEKQETRSDWLQRPLTQAQIRYAAVDVVYLHAIWRRLAEALNRRGYYDFVLEECAAQAKGIVSEEAPERYYLRFSQACRMRPEQLAVLQKLAAWRETESRRRDIPRNFLLHNNSLLAIAQRPPRNMAELSRIERMRGRSLKQDGRQILALIREAREPGQFPEPPPRPLSAAASKLLKKLRAEAAAVGEATGIAPELLARKRDLEALIRSGWSSGPWQLPSGLDGWRRKIIGERLLALLSGADNGNEP